MLEFTILDADGEVVSLAGVSGIVLKYKSYNSSGAATSITGTIVSPEDGTCTFDVGTKFQSVTGKYKAEIQITYGSGKVITAPGLIINVIEDL